MISAMCQRCKYRAQCPLRIFYRHFSIRRLTDACRDRRAEGFWRSGDRRARFSKAMPGAAHANGLPCLTAAGSGRERVEIARLGGFEGKPRKRLGFLGLETGWKVAGNRLATFQDSGKVLARF